MSGGGVELSCDAIVLMHVSLSLKHSQTCAHPKTKQICLGPGKVALTLQPGSQDNGKRTESREVSQQCQNMCRSIRLAVTANYTLKYS